MKTIHEIGKSFLGVTEKPGNSGFLDSPEVQSLTNMQPEELFKTLGWHKGWAWCMFVPKAIWNLYYTQYDTTLANNINALFTPSVRDTFKNFETQKEIEVSKSPKVGAIAIWSLFKNGVKQWQGHAGIVVDCNLSEFYTIEGNTNKKGEREGTVVREKTRSYNYHDKEGLVLQGFIIAPEIK